MTIDLAELNERIDYCDEQISDFERRVTEFKRRHLVFDVSPSPDEEPVGTYSIHARVTAHIPTSIRSQVGMIINELRSTLDSLAVMAAISNGGNGKNVYFPVSKTIEIFMTDGERKILQLNDKHKEFIRNLHPYKGGNETLYRLHASDVQRKHIRLSPSSLIPVIHPQGFGLPAGGRATFERCMFNGIFVERMSILGISKGALKTTNSPVHIVSGAPNNLPLHIDSGVFFDSPEDVEGWSIPHLLHEWSAIVRSIVSNFA